MQTLTLVYLLTPALKLYDDGEAKEGVGAGGSFSVWI